MRPTGMSNTGKASVARVEVKYLVEMRAHRQMMLAINPHRRTVGIDDRDGGRLLSTWRGAA